MIQIEKKLQGPKLFEQEKKHTHILVREAKSFTWLESAIESYQFIKRYGQKIYGQKICGA